MSHQNIRNHYRYIPLWHFITSLAIIAVLIGSIVNLSKSTSENLYSASLIFVIALILSSFFWYARWFALRVQDRAIRAEEQLRHFVLTGKLLDPRLTMQQIIALRFASNEEFLALAQRAADQNMAAKDIKQAVKSWRADTNRV